MTIEADPGAVGAHRGPGVGMAGGLLHISKRHAGVEGTAVMKAWPSVCGVTLLVIPAVRARA
ncbi:MAG: hypothetical protein M3144_02850 [Actinomycetota bacterium]|nr:hypothetical protein [Actinomycetota bacterium]